MIIKGKEVSLSDVVTGILIATILLVLTTLFLQIQPVEDPNLIINQNFPQNKFFDAEIKVRNFSHKNYVLPNDFLQYEITVSPKRDDVETLSGVLDVTYGDNVVDDYGSFSFSFEHGAVSNTIRIPIHLENLGENTIRFQISLDQIPEEQIHRDDEGEMIGIVGAIDWVSLTSIDVRSAIDVIQTETLETQRWAISATTFIGFATVIALIINSYISHRQARILDEQKNIMKENSDKQILVFKEQNKISKKHTEYLAMLEIMKIFNDPRIADERNQIYYANRNNVLYSKDGQILGPDLPVYVASVRGTFDQMGKLVLDDYVPKDQFLEMYCGSVIKMYKVLRRHIEYERNRRNTKHFSVYFETIFNESIAYWKNKFPGEPEPEPF